MHVSLHKRWKTNIIMSSMEEPLEVIVNIARLLNHRIIVVVDGIDCIR